jgi:two-component system cell cycle response regulator
MTDPRPEGPREATDPAWKAEVSVAEESAVAETGDPAAAAGNDAPEVVAEAGPARTAPRSEPDFDKTIVSDLRTIAETGRTVATLVVVRGPDMGRHYQLRRNRVVIGRSDVADFVLHDREVSRAHAMISLLHLGSEAIYRLTDLGSTNHVYVNGNQTAEHFLADGDKIQLGEVLLKFELHDAIDSKFHTEIRHRIHYDDLTGLLTYESFRTALTWELERESSAAKGCAVVMMDLDDFKKLNDTHGHLAGSAVLREVGSVIRGRIRHFDVAARYGGEEFVAYLPETEAGEAWTAAERLRATIERHPFAHGERHIPVTISMGISHFPEDGRELAPLVQRADERLYRAKREGKNRVIGVG